MSCSVLKCVDAFKVVNDLGVYSVLLPTVTATDPRRLATREPPAILTTLSGEQASRNGDNVYETLSGARWRLAR